MTIEEQFIILVTIVISSYIIGFLFDGYSTLFIKLNVGKVVTIIFDIGFGIVSAALIFLLLLWLNNGQLRVIIIFAFFLALLLYYITLSRRVIKFWEYCYKIIYKVIKLLINLINLIIIKPLKVIKDILLLIIKKIIKIINCLFLSKPRKVISELKRRKIKKEDFISVLKKIIFIKK